jgi:hypothetical protein
MSPRPDATLVFPKVHDDEPSVHSVDGTSALDVLGAYVRSSSPLRVYERPTLRRVPEDVMTDQFQKAR